MRAPSVRLHAKLYRAKAVDLAIELAEETANDIEIMRQRDGDYHVVALTGLEGESAKELLLELADAALLATVELDAT